MEPKKYFSKINLIENIENNDLTAAKYNYNFMSCDYCQGRPQGSFKKQKIIGY